MIPVLIALLLAPPALDETQVVRALKESERAGYEEHDLNGLLARFATDARWIIGRRSVVDAHDIVLDMARAKAVLKLDFSGIPAAQRVEFSEVEVALDSDPPTVELIEKRKFHGGRGIVGVRFTLRRSAKGWQVVERRQWPLEERVGVIPTLYNDAHWLDADSALDQPGTDDAVTRLDAFLAARRYAEARALALMLIKAPAPLPDYWSFLARAEYRLGNIAAARKAAREASRRGALTRVPAVLGK